MQVLVRLMTDNCLLTRLLFSYPVVGILKVQGPTIHRLLWISSVERFSKGKTCGS